VIGYTVLCDFRNGSDAFETSLEHCSFKEKFYPMVLTCKICTWFVVFLLCLKTLTNIKNNFHHMGTLRHTSDQFLHSLGNKD